MHREMKSSITSLLWTSTLAIILGIVMLLYPGGTMALMSTAFAILQAGISIFILAHALQEALHGFRGGKRWAGIAALIIGVAAICIVWLFDIRTLMLIFAVFCVAAGAAEIIKAFCFPLVRNFLLLLGFINIMAGIIIIKYPIALPLLIAWYIFFWGLSHLFLALELKRLVR